MTWQSSDRWHVALMNLLASQAGDDPWSRLWLAVIDRALADAYVTTGGYHEDRRWTVGVRSWFGGPRFRFACEQAGLDVDWVRQLIAKYERERGRLKQCA